MKIFFTCLLVLIAFGARSQTEPALPSPCFSNGKANQNNLTVSGNSIFTFSNLSSFTSTQVLSNITVNVKSSAKYRLYIAGEITYSGTSPNTPIPIDTFSITASNRGTSPSNVPLSASYLEVAQRGSSTAGLSHVLTITRNPLPDFTQGPGTHTLTLHIRYCQY